MAKQEICSLYCSILLITMLKHCYFEVNQSSWNKVLAFIINKYKAWQRDRETGDRKKFNFKVVKVLKATDYFIFFISQYVFQKIRLVFKQNTGQWDRPEYHKGIMSSCYPRFMVILTNHSCLDSSNWLLSQIKQQLTVKAGLLKI